MMDQLPFCHSEHKRRINLRVKIRGELYRTNTGIALQLCMAAIARLLAIYRVTGVGE
jgi:hypothetical protein